MKLITEFIDVPSKPRPGIIMTTYDSITIHWIGPFPKQEVRDPVKWWVDNKLEASAHFVVKDDMVLNCIPVNEVAWHCGTPKGNYCSIGIEVIPVSTEGEFNRLTILTLKELLSTLPKVPLLRHYDWTKKDCPRWYTPYTTDGDLAWDKLKKELEDGREKVLVSYQ